MNTTVYTCTLCTWEGATTPAAYNAVAPNKRLHNLCERHLAMYRHKYKGVLPIAAHDRMVKAQMQNIMERMEQ